MSKPITPSEAKKSALSGIPDYVFDTVNAMIAEKIGSGNTVILIQDEIVKRIVKSVLPKIPATFRQDLFDKHYMDFEPAYEKAGWKVEYDKPAWCETGDPTFTFTRKRGK